MPNYRRTFIPGDTWFFTVNLMKRNDDDYRRHVEYVHVNPVKYGLVAHAQDWPYSTFHRYVKLGIYPLDWCADPVMTVEGGD